MSEKQAKRHRKENQVTIVVDLEVAQWMLGFFGALVAPLGDVLTPEVINSHQVMKSIERGLDDQTKSQSSSAR
jgi:uncharacterized protein YaiI (UPF0178 family)